METISTCDLETVTGGGAAVSTSPEVGSFWFGRKQAAPRDENGVPYARSVSPEVGSFWTGGSDGDETDENGVPYARSVSPRTGSFWTGR